MDVKLDVAHFLQAFRCNNPLKLKTLTDFFPLFIDLLLPSFVLSLLLLCFLVTDRKQTHQTLHQLWLFFLRLLTRFLNLHSLYYLMLIMLMSTRTRRLLLLLLTPVLVKISYIMIGHLRLGLDPISDPVDHVASFFRVWVER
jgi:hypothetical protein